MTRGNSLSQTVFVPCFSFPEAQGRRFPVFFRLYRRDEYPRFAMPALKKESNAI